MITSKQIIKLSETWATNIKGYSIQVPLYINPDSSDKKELYRAYKINDHFVRFIADAQTQKVYVWDGTEAIHIQAIQSLGWETYNQVYDKPNILMGYAHLQNGNINFDLKKEDMVDHLSSSIQALNSYHLWGFSDSETKEKFGDDINRNYYWLSKFFKYDWSFIDRYISGIWNYINQKKLEFKNWNNKYSNRFL